MSLYGYRGMGHMRNEDARAILERMHQNPLTAYSTKQLEEELTRRCREHVALRLRVKLQLIRSARRMEHRRRTGEGTL